EESGNVKIIEAPCSLDEPFYYELGEGEQAELMEGSVRIDGEIVRDNKVDIDIKDDVLTVSTDYFESYEGFGEAYLGDDYEITLNLNVLDLNIEKEGTHTLTITLVYEDEELMNASEEIEVKPESITIKIIDKDGNIEDEILASSTKIKIKIKKIVVGGEEEHEIEIEDNVISITGAAIIETKQALPESEINFITFSNNTIIQIDNPTKTQEVQGITTEIFAIEPDKDIEIETATITLRKIGDVSNIIYCDDWDIEKFNCQSSWQDS
ncbi:unnamed protein product, partial [marine sediment metagenome]